MRSMLTAGLVGVLALGLTTGLGAGDGASAAQTRRDPSQGSREIFRDDFGGTSLDRKRWQDCYPWAADGSGCTNFSNPELQWFVPSQVRVDRGRLRLVAAQIPTAGVDSANNPKDYPWRSGMVTTYPAGSFTYGYVEVDARLPAGDGLWSILWLLPYDFSWPPEVDIAEIYGNDPGSLNLVLHGTQGVRRYRTVETADLSKRYHKYGLDWRPDSLTWFLDGQVVFRYSGPAVPSTPMYFLATLAVGNFVTAHPTATTPARASLDIRRVTIFQT